MPGRRPPRCCLRPPVARLLRWGRGASPCPPARTRRGAPEPGAGGAPGAGVPAAALRHHRAGELVKPAVSPVTAYRSLGLPGEPRCPGTARGAHRQSQAVPERSRRHESSPTGWRCQAAARHGRRRGQSCAGPGSALPSIRLSACAGSGFGTPCLLRSLCQRHLQVGCDANMVLLQQCTGVAPGIFLGESCNRATMGKPSKAQHVAGRAVAAVTARVLRARAAGAGRAGCHQQWHKRVLVQEEPGSCLLLGGGLGRRDMPSAWPGASPQSQARSLTSPAVPRG